jgi:hypothetical protein
MLTKFHSHSILCSLYILVNIQGVSQRKCTHIKWSMVQKCLETLELADTFSSSFACIELPLVPPPNELCIGYQTQQ